MTTTQDHFYRLATSQAALEKGANFFILALPRPDLVTYAEFTARLPSGQGGESRQGYEVLSLLWNRLSRSQAATLRRYIEAAEVSGGAGNGTLYLTVPKTNGEGGWIDVSGVAIMPDWPPDPGGSGASYNNVLLRLNNVTVLADPSTVG